MLYLSRAVIKRYLKFQLGLCKHIILQPISNCNHEICCHHILALLTARDSQVLGHDAIDINSVNTRLFQALGERDHIGRVVEPAALHQPPCPSKDAGDGICRRRVAILMLAVVPRYRTVGDLAMERLAVGSY